MDAGRSKIECFLLTWHGTVIAHSADGNGLTQKPLAGPECLAEGCRLTVETRLTPAFAQQLPLPDESLPYASGALGSGVAVRSPGGLGYHFARYGIFLSAAPDAGAVDWNRELPQDWESFLPVPVEVLARLLAVGAGDWVDLATGEVILRSSIAFKPRLRFAAGRFEFSLTKCYPTFFARGAAAAGGRDAFLLTHHDAVHALAPLRGERDADTHILLRFAENETGDGGNADRAPVLESKPAPVFPPAFAHRDDRQYFFTKGWRGHAPRLGYAASAVQLREERNVYMFLGRTLEGLVFDPDGVRRHYGFLLASQELPECVTREGDRFLLASNALARAPLLPGHYAAFFNGNVQNYFHWLAEGLVSLFALRKLVSGGLKIVLPASLDGVSNIEYVESLKLLGFGDLEIVLSDAPVVRLERVSWIRSVELVDDMPAEIFREFQSRAAAVVAGAARGRRVYIERRHGRAIANAAEVRQFLEERGFETVLLEEISLLEQLKLFAGADFVVGPHGAGLSNLVFAPPATRVIELAPNSEMRPFFWNIGSKLGHEYGLLPCPTDGGGFNGNLHVDLGKLSRLFTLLEKA